MSKITAIGIDFGTTNTCVAVRDSSGAVRVLPMDPSASDPRLIKTLLYFPSRREAFFGKQAIDQYFERGMEGRFFQSVKRLLPNPEFTGTSLFGSHMGIEEFISRFLIELKTRIEKEIGPIDGIPVNFGRPARYSLEPAREGLAVVRFKTALDQAGFRLTRLTEEPVAAAAATPEKDRNTGLTLVADLGGGTSDFTIFRIDPKLGSPDTRSVHGVPVAGDSLDSDFFVARLNEKFGSTIQYQRPFSSNVLTMPTMLVKQLPKWHHHAFLRERATWNFIVTLRKEIVDPKQKPLLENLISLVEENLGYKLHLSVEGLKVALSDQAEADFSFKSYPIDIGFPVTKTEFESIIEPSVEEIRKTALETCRIGRLDPSEIDVLQFTGGTSKVPAVRRALAACFPKARVIDHETFTAVAEGLAVLG